MAASRRNRSRFPACARPIGATGDGGPVAGRGPRGVPRLAVANRSTAARVARPIPTARGSQATSCSPNPTGSKAPPCSTRLRAISIVSCVSSLMPAKRGSNRSIRIRPCADLLSFGWPSASPSAHPTRAPTMRSARGAVAQDSVSASPAGNWRRDHPLVNELRQRLARSQHPLLRSGSWHAKGRAPVDDLLQVCQDGLDAFRMGEPTTSIHGGPAVPRGAHGTTSSSPHGSPRRHAGRPGRTARRPAT